MKIIISSLASKRIQEIFEFYKSEENPSVAKAIINKKLSRIKLLKKNPYLGTEEKSLLFLNKNYRKLVCRDSKLIYHIVDNEIWVDTVFHAKQEPFEMSKDF